MVLAQVAKYFSSSSDNTPQHLVSSGPEGGASFFRHDKAERREGMEKEDMDYEAARPPYPHAILAGGLGGLTGDMLMHSLDTVKTRQQGDPHMPPKYTSMGSTYYTIFRQEGVRRGLYGGVQPAFLGSFSGTAIFFGTYEWSKRRMIDAGITPSLAYLTAGFIADLAAAPVYVPSEVLKTRMQLQGRHNNPFFYSGFNYRSLTHATTTIIRTEGFSALFHGFKATLVRDLPFSGLQFAFYEQEQKLAKQWCGRKDIGLPLEILTGASAGGMAGVITCPLDVVKTRIQTASDLRGPVASKSKTPNPPPPAKQAATQAATQAAKQTLTPATSPPKSKPSTTPSVKSGPKKNAKRMISTSSPSTALKQHHAVTLDTSSVITGLRLIYKTEGFAGWFRGVGPRFVWTSVQSGTMLVLYQTLLRWFEAHPLVAHDPIP